MLINHNRYKDSSASVIKRLAGAGPGGQVEGGADDAVHQGNRHHYHLPLDHLQHQLQQPRPQVPLVPQRSGQSNSEALTAPSTVQKGKMFGLGGMAYTLIIGFISS